MPAVPRTKLTKLPESRVRLDIEVSAEELADRVQRKAATLGRGLKLAGFRRGKVPPALVLQRLGWEAVLDEVVREDLGHWYVSAIEQSRIVPVGDPKVEIGKLPQPGEALELSVEIGVLPEAKLGQYRGLEVGRAEPEVSEEQIDSEVQRLRERLGRLETAERPAQPGDFVVIDYQGTMRGDGRADHGGAGPEELSGRDRLVELGAERLLGGFEEALVGASAGEQRTVDVSFPQDHPDERLAGREASFEVVLKEVKLRELPAVDEDFAIDVGFDSVEELRQDIRSKLLEAEQRRIDAEFREAALDEAVANSSVSTPAELVQARAGEMWERMVHSLEHRGVSREAYLQIDGRTEEQILSELQSDADQALRREAVITAVVAAEGIEPDEQEMLEAVAAAAQEREVEPERLLEELRGAGRLEELREDLAARAAIDLIASSAEPIPIERARAREKLWTPQDSARRERVKTPEDSSERAGELWTPGR